MIYAVSDLHGRYDRYRQLLDKLDLGEQDTLYVLGDALDRGPEGFRILWDMASRPQMVGLLGNHEAMALDALPGLLGSLENSRASMSRSDRANVSLWFSNGGESSLRDFLRLDKGQRQEVWAYMGSLPLYREVKAGGRDFLLVHGGLGHFSPSRPLPLILLGFSADGERRIGSPRKAGKTLFRQISFERVSVSKVRPAGTCRFRWNSHRRRAGTSGLRPFQT